MRPTNGLPGDHFNLVQAPPPSTDSKQKSGIVLWINDLKTSL